jgi:RimJ/RimL family protein N-acetyltransferase
LLITGVGELWCERADLAPRKGGQLEYAQPREQAWQQLRIQHGEVALDEALEEARARAISTAIGEVSAERGAAITTIGYTFLSRAHWGRSYNRALKTPMLDHAFRRPACRPCFSG